MHRIVDRERNRIRFTHFIPPYGIRVLIWFDMPTPDAMDKAEHIVAAGFEFHIEILRSGLVSATISDSRGDYAFALHEDGPGLEKAINKMIVEFDIEAAKKQSEENKGEEE